MNLTKVIDNRFIGFDILKFICTFLVVCIHAPFEGVLGDIIITIARIAVPIFFMITGYYYIDTKKRGNELKQIKKICKLLILSNLLYFVWGGILQLTKNGDILTYIFRTFSVKSIIKFFVLNVSPFSGHLWYLGAILYVLVIVLLLDKINKINVLFIISPILIICDLIFGKYSLLIFHCEFPYVLLRNFVFVGIPYFTIGLITRECINKNSKFNINLLLLMTFIFLLMNELEHFILVFINANANRDQYIFTTFLSIVIFLLVYSLYKNKFLVSHVEKFMAYGGRNLSTMVYVLHPIFINLFEFLVDLLGFSGVFNKIAPIIIFIVTLIFALSVDKVANQKKKYFISF